MRLIQKAGLKGNKAVARPTDAWDELIPLPERIEKILAIVKNTNTHHMIYFIMYDIEDNKIRKYLSQYLIEKGCIRIQKSVFLTSSERKTFKEIAETLKEVNAMYANADSIVMVPISTDEIKSMRVIGRKIDLNLFLDKPNTMIF